MPQFDELVQINSHDLVLTQEGVTQIQLDASQSDLIMGGMGSNGDIFLFDTTGAARGLLTPTYLSFRNEAQEETVKIDATQTDLIMGGAGSNGDIFLYDTTGAARGLLTPTYLSFRNEAQEETVKIDGIAGEIYLTGADCAELFDAGNEGALEAGTVLVVDEQERLWPCCVEYDRKVAGVASGAGGVRPGVVLGAVPSRGARVPLALTGKAFAKVDAQFGAIEVGDLLTTSPTPGHAMCARDSARAFGAVIGKALRGHQDGRGMIPVLIALQ